MRFGAICAVFLYVFTAILPAAPWLEYWVNHDYIADVLCINKDAPRLQCDGKCHLKAQMEQLEQVSSADPASDPQPIPGRLIEVFIALPGVLQSASLTAETDAKNFTDFYRNAYSFLMIVSRDKPPRDSYVS